MNDNRHPWNDGLKRREKEAINRAWRNFEHLVGLRNQRHSLDTCLRHDARERGRYYAKIVMMREFGQGLHDKELPTYSLSISLGCLWARAYGAAGKEDFSTHYPRDLEEFEQSLPAAVAPMQRQLEETRARLAAL